MRRGGPKVQHALTNGADPMGLNKSVPVSELIGSPRHSKRRQDWSTGPQSIQEKNLDKTNLNKIYNIVQGIDLTDHLRSNQNV